MPSKRRTLSSFMALFIFLISSLIACGLKNSFFFKTQTAEIMKNIAFAIKNGFSSIKLKSDSISKDKTICAKQIRKKYTIPVFFLVIQEVKKYEEIRTNIREIKNIYPTLLTCSLRNCKIYIYFVLPLRML